MSNIDVIALARELAAARATGTIVPEPLSARYEGFNITTAYAVEAEIMRLRVAEGHKTTGLKVGYANKAMWRALKLETLVWAHMYEDTVHFSESVALPYYESCRIEPEIVFKLKEPMTTDVLDAVEWLAIGFEIIHCPFPEWKFHPADFVAAFGLHLALVVGQPTFVGPAQIPGLRENLAGFKVRVLRDGEFVEEGSGKNSLRSPALCLAELGRATPLGAGDLVSSGTLTAGHEIGKGEVWRVDIEGLPLSGLTVELK